MNYFPIILGLLGGLSLFLYGVTRLSLSLRKIAGDKMKRVFERITTLRTIIALRRSPLDWITASKREKTWR